MVTFFRLYVFLYLLLWIILRKANQRRKIRMTEQEK